MLVQFNDLFNKLDAFPEFNYIDFHYSPVDSEYPHSIPHIPQLYSYSHKNTSVASAVSIYIYHNSDTGALSAAICEKNTWDDLILSKSRYTTHGRKISRQSGWYSRAKGEAAIIEELNRIF